MGRLNDLTKDFRPGDDPKIGDVYPSYADVVEKKRRESLDALCNAADNSACMVGTPQQRQLNKQAVLASLQRQLNVKAAEVEKLHRAITILTLHPEFDMFLELNHLLEGIKL